MAAEKSFAIVTRVVDFSETSCVVTLFTEGFGKITGLAKGARRPKGPFESALDVLSLCRVVFLHKTSEALDLLTEAKLERRFRSASRDLSRLYAGYYIIELLNRLTHEGDPHRPLFSAANTALESLDQRADIVREIFQFEMTALRSLGHLPRFSNCVGCEKEIDTNRRVSFGLLEGGGLCPNCKQGKRQVISVSSEAVHAMQAYSRDEDFVDFEVSKRTNGELRGVLNRYMAHLLGNPPRMRSYLNMLSR